jgi:hypothetical protein
VIVQPSDSEMDFRSIIRVQHRTLVDSKQICFPILSVQVSSLGLVFVLSVLLSCKS